jgi:hypothetical protein
MQANKLCPAPNLEAADLCGEPKIVTIKDVGFKVVGEAKVEKGAVYFKEFDRPLIVNRTNIKRIIALHGTDTDLWKEKRVELYPSEADFAGKTVPCIRVRERMPAEAK